MNANMKGLAATASAKDRGIVASPLIFLEITSVNEAGQCTRALHKQQQTKQSVVIPVV